MKTLVLHHSGGNQNRPAYDDWISGKKWYNWINDGAGKLHEFKTTPNQRSCGETYDLAFSGDFTKVDPTPAQIATWKKFLKEHNFDIITTHGQLAKDKPGCATVTACPGRLLDFITLTTSPPMTCEQELPIAKEQIRILNTELGVVTPQRDKALADLAQEKAAHLETAMRADDNYNNWQFELDRRKKAEAKLLRIKSITQE